MKVFTKWGAISIILLSAAVICFGQRGAETVQRRSLRRSPLRTIQLPEPKLTGQMSLEQVLAKQADIRSITGQPLKSSTISQLAWAAQVTIGRIQQPGMQLQIGLLMSPGEETYPIEIYFVTQDGVFLYNPSNHSLEQVSNQDVRGGMVTGILNQQAVAVSGCDIIIAGSVRNFAGRIGSDARRAALLETGRIAQNIQLQAISLELGCIPISDFDTRTTKRICNIARNLEPLYILSVGYIAEQTTAEGTEEQLATLEVRRAVLIVARDNFRDEELFETKRVLDMAGVETTIASTRLGAIRGMLGGVAQASLLVQQMRVDDYDAIVFVGGPGAVEYFDNPIAHNIAREAVNKGRVLAAINIAPAILANAGVLVGVRATSYPTEQARLMQAGAIYTGSAVERAGIIVTAIDPMATTMFGRAIVDAFSGM